MTLMANIDIKNGYCTTNRALDIENFIKNNLSDDVKLCIIDLDCAVSGVGKSKQFHFIKKFPGHLWYGGGLRSVDDISHVLSMGAAGAVIGSALYKKGYFNQTLAMSILSSFPTERILFSVDFKEGKIVTNGFQRDTDIPIIDVLGWFHCQQKNVNLAVVDVNASLYGNKININFIKKLRKEYSCIKLWYAGNIQTLQQVKDLKEIGVNSIIGKAYIKNSATWQSKFKDLLKKVK